MADYSRIPPFRDMFLFSLVLSFGVVSILGAIVGLVALGLGNCHLLAVSLMIGWSSSLGLGLVINYGRTGRLLG